VVEEEAPTQMWSTSMSRFNLRKYETNTIKRENNSGLINHVVHQHVARFNLKKYETHENKT